MNFKTQSSSKARLKNDTLGDNALIDLYAKYEVLDLEPFREFCIEMVQSGGGRQTTKNHIIESIRNTNNKVTMMKKAQDFTMAGMGVGV